MAADRKSRTLSRRDWVRGTAAAGLLAGLPTLRVFAQRTGLIDVHQHFRMPGLTVRVPDEIGWTPAHSIEQMDEFDIETGVVSAPASYDLYQDSDDSRRLTRTCNEFMARMASDHPGRFGFFGVLPLPDVDSCLREIELIFDELGGHGIGLFSNVGDKWPGDPQFDAVFAELDRRGAVVFIHPIVADCCHTLLPNVNEGILEYDFDTTRAVVSLLVNGTLARYPNVRFIVNHSGAAVPALAGRIQARVPDNPPAYPNGVLYELQKLYYEVGHATYPWPMAALTELVTSSQILFGSDYPFQAVETTVSGLADFPLTAADRHAIQRGNAEMLFPRLRAAA